MITNCNPSTSARVRILTLTVMVVLGALFPAMATRYKVIRAWTGAGGSASLAGTVDVPIGSYTIMNGTPSPFTAVNLALTVNGTPSSLHGADTVMGMGATAKFLIEASASTLTFDTANANGQNPADLVFGIFETDLYGIGYDAVPGFEVGRNAGGMVTAAVTMPTVFGIPEPASIISEPQNQAVLSGESTTLNVSAGGDPPLTYQWSLNGLPIAGATGTSLVISNFDLTKAGVYWVVVTNQYGYATATTVVRLMNSPMVLVDGVDLAGGTVDRFNSAQITVSNGFGSGTDIYYTLDGSVPDYTKKFYSGSFALTRSATIRAIAYNQTYTASAETASITVQMFNAATDGGGSVSLSPASGSGFNGYVTNTLVTATATPSNGWSFLCWLGEASGTNPVVAAAMTPDKLVKALFGAALSTNVLGSGSIVLSPQGPFYPFGTVARLTALPQEGNYFFAWHGTVTGTNNPVMLVINQPTQVVTATFASLPASEYSLSVVSDGQGSGAANPYALFYTSGQTVWLSATPDAGQAFLGWSGDATGTDNPLTVTINQSKVITANFTKWPVLSIPADLAGLRPNGFRVFVIGEFGAAYQILSSTNLTDWSLVGEVTNSFGTVQFTDPAATNLPACIYRAALVRP